MTKRKSVGKNYKDGGQNLGQCINQLINYYTQLIIDLFKRAWGDFSRFDGERRPKWLI